MINTFMNSLMIDYDIIFFTIKQTDDIIKITYKNIKKEIVLKRNIKNNCFECISHQLLDDGYSRVKINQKGIRLHRLVYCLFHNIELNKIKGLVIRHMCGSKNCSNSKHLLPGTHEQNAWDRKMHNMTACGERNGSSKLNEIAVMCIRDNENGMPDDYYAEMYSVTTKTIIDIKQGKTWKHLL